ncbi:unnamed protein product, partial [Vitrella brassicaformis CCMP3155]
VRGEYWANHITLPVRFMDGMRAMVEAGARVIVEVGPRPTLIGMGKQCVQEVAEKMDLHWLGPMDPDKDDQDGVSLTIETCLAKVKGTHQWDHQSFSWVETAHPALGQRLTSPRGLTFESTLRQDLKTLIEDHVVLGVPLMPGAGFIDILASAGLAAAQVERGAKISAAELVHLEDVSFQRPLMLPKPDDKQPDPRMPTIRITVEKQPTTDSDAAMPPMAVEITTQAPGEEDFVSHATGRLVKVAHVDDSESDLVEDLTTLKHRCNKTVPLAEFYTQLKEIGLAYGPRFQTVTELFVSDDQALALLKLDLPIEPFEGGFRLHPAILDGALQSAAAILAANQSGKRKTKAALVPVGAERVSLARIAPSSELWSHVRLLKREDRAATIDVVIQDSTGRIAAYLKNVSLRQMDTTPPADIPATSSGRSRGNRPSQARSLLLLRRGLLPLNQGGLCLACRLPGRRCCTAD